MCNVFPSGILCGPWPTSHFPQHSRSRAALPFRIWEALKDRLLDNVLEFFEDLLGRIVLHRSMTLWHRWRPWHQNYVIPKSFRARLIARWRACVSVFGFFRKYVLISARPMP